MDLISLVGTPATVSATDLITNNSGYAIGYYDQEYSGGYLGPSIFNGTIDAIYLWNRTFTDREVRDIYARTKSRYYNDTTQTEVEGGLSDTQYSITVYTNDSLDPTVLSFWSCDVFLL